MLCNKAYVRCRAGDARKPCATIEGRIVDVCHTVGDCYTRKPGAIIEGIHADARHVVADCHVCKPATTGKGTPSDARHAVGDCCARKPFATRECRDADVCHAAVRRNNACITTQYQRFRCRFNKAVAGTMIFCVAFRDNYACKLCTSKERTVTNTRHSVAY